MYLHIGSESQSVISEGLSSLSAWPEKQHAPLILTLSTDLLQLRGCKTKLIPWDIKILYSCPLNRCTCTTTTTLWLRCRWTPTWWSTPPCSSTRSGTDYSDCRSAPSTRIEAENEALAFWPRLASSTRPIAQVCFGEDEFFYEPSQLQNK